jgi:hypothetical protein
MSEPPATYDLDYAADHDSIEDRDTGALDELHCDVCATPIPYKQVHQLHFNDGDFWWLCRKCADERGLDDSALVELEETTPTPVVKPWENTRGAAPIIGVPEPQLVLYGNLYFKQTTPEAVMHTLQNAYACEVRIRLHYGDKETGRDWQEENDIEGYVGKTTGAVPIPILVYNKRCLGGCAILTDCIVKITTAGRKHRVTRWQHPHYHIPIEINPQERLLSVLAELQVQQP